MIVITKYSAPWEETLNTPTYLFIVQYEGTGHAHSCTMTDEGMDYFIEELRKAGKEVVFKEK